MSVFAVTNQWQSAQSISPGHSLYHGFQDKCGKKRSWLERVVQVAPRCFQTVGNLSDIYFLNVLCCGWAYNSTWAPRYIIFCQEVGQIHSESSQIWLWSDLPTSENHHFSNFIFRFSRAIAIDHPVNISSCSCHHHVQRGARDCDSLRS